MKDELNPPFESKWADGRQTVCQEIYNTLGLRGTQILVRNTEVMAHVQKLIDDKGNGPEAQQKYETELKEYLAPYNPKRYALHAAFDKTGALIRLEVSGGPQDEYLRIKLEKSGPYFYCNDRKPGKNNRTKYNDIDVTPEQACKLALKRLTELTPEDVKSVNISSCSKNSDKWLYYLEPDANRSLVFKNMKEEKNALPFWQDDPVAWGLENITALIEEQQQKMTLPESPQFTVGSSRDLTGKIKRDAGVRIV